MLLLKIYEDFLTFFFDKMDVFLCTKCLKYIFLVASGDVSLNCWAQRALYVCYMCCYCSCISSCFRTTVCDHKMPFNLIINFRVDSYVLGSVFFFFVVVAHNFG